MTATASVVIATRNRAAALAATLASLGATEDQNWELVIVDNGSSDGTGEVIEAFADRVPLVHLELEEPGLSRAVNLGVTRARGEIVLRTDDDVVVPPTWVTCLAAPMRSGMADVVAGGVTIAPHLVRPWMTEYHRVALGSTELIDASVPTVIGANYGFRRTVFDAVGGFDELLGAGALGFGDETVFTYRARDLGFRLAAALHCSVEHHPDESRLGRDAWVRRARATGRSEASIAARYFGAEPRWSAVRQLRDQLALSLVRLGDLGRTPAEGISTREAILRHRIAYQAHLRQTRS